MSHQLFFATSFIGQKLEFSIELKYDFFNCEYR